VLASRAVDQEYESRSGQNKDYTIGIYCFPAKHTALRKKSKDSLARIMCLSWATYLSVDSCFNALALKHLAKRVGLVQSGTHHHFIEN
jgi:hypothetical protein